ncbi:hypothetical protein BSR29_05795 [Boudabousia liubingyangii]|uniref:Translocase n=1 Tax=Boudabousia liubingyangii TaxID=1921764 RepID=A0A1Q5PLS3_9ACTO|nr:twin-arginine translocase TatA/TatE family subunit [Boudabousia liubingyangii]OKL46901.1 hypothetical protein BSR28_05605 [Boudabousia liubingyangii]OKL47990.1 hypothetical protein BSR29_05795 [Boudabousia liubingyangii]
MEFFGINWAEAGVLLVLALLIFGPQQLAAGLAWIRSSLATLRDFSAATRQRVAQEAQLLNPELSSELGPQGETFQAFSQVQQELHSELDSWATLGSDMTKKQLEKQEAQL